MNFLQRGKALLAVLALGLGLAVAACDDNSNNGNNTQQQQQSTTQSAAPQSAAPVAAAPVAAPKVSNGVVALTKNYYVVFDGSGSMNDCPPATARKRNCVAKIDGAKAALRAWVAGLPNDVNLGLYVFDRYGDREVVPLSGNNKKAFLAAVDAVRADNGTPLGEAVEYGVKVLQKQYEAQLGYGEFRLVVVTDGQATGHVSIADAVAEASQAKVPIFTIGFGIGKDHELNRYSVQYWAADTDSDVRQALSEIATELDPDDPGMKK